MLCAIRLPSHGVIAAAPLLISIATPLRRPALRCPAMMVSPAEPQGFDVVGNLTGAFEGVVRAATGDEDYKFGDWTKNTVTQLTGKPAEDYKFGDITKSAVTSFTGKEDYQVRAAIPASRSMRVSKIHALPSNPDQPRARL